MLYRLLATIAKLLIASLVVGMVLNSLNITAEQVLIDLGLTPERIMSLLRRGFLWALPNIVLGAIVIVPVWLVIYLFRPPRGE